MYSTYEQSKVSSLDSEVATFPTFNSAKQTATHDGAAYQLLLATFTNFYNFY